MPPAIYVSDCSLYFSRIGYFMLTEPHGLNYITHCEEEGFHVHPKEPPLYEVRTSVNTIIWIAAVFFSSFNVLQLLLYIPIYLFFFFKLGVTLTHQMPCHLLCGPHETFQLLCIISVHQCYRSLLYFHLFNFQVKNFYSFFFPVSLSP